jgi:molecular chaperone DnaK
MAKVIGIDLGTTNSVVAHEDRTGVDVVLNRANERVTCSVVGLHAKSGETLVGTAAADNAARNPENTIFSIKRLMGRFYDDPNVQEVQRRYQYRVVKPEDGDDVRVMLGDRMLTPTEVSAMIMRKMKEDAEARLGDEVTHAVITVPAYFSMSQRLATRMAGEMAGVRVKTIIDEPTAAAMAFGVDLEPRAMKNVLVYDLGGGTFDISVLFISGEMFTQMAIEGDMWLGGDDFDHAIMDYVLKAVQKEHNTDPSNNGQFMVLLKKAAEKAKIELSEMLSTAIMLAAAVPLPDGSRGDVDVDLNRRTFEDLPITSGTIKFGGVEAEELRRWCEELKINGTYTEHGVEFGPETVRNRIKKTLLLARKAVKEAGVEEINHVLLVGGSTTLPLVQRMLDEEFGPDKIMRNIDPMACVASGAGIAAARIPGIICQNVVGKDAGGNEILCLESNGEDATTCHKCGAQLVAQKMCPECNYPNALDAQECSNPEGCGHVFKRVDPGNVTAKPIGILAAGGVYEVIVAKSTPYPTTEPVVRPFRTAEDSQTAVLVPIYHAQVNEFSPDDVTQWIGAADIDLEGTHLPAETPVDVSVGIDRDGCLDIEATIQDGSGRRKKVFVDPRLGVDGGKKDEPEGEAEAQDTIPKWQSDLEWSILWAEIALRDYEWAFSDHRTTQTLRRLVADGQEAIKRKDEAKGRRLEAEIDKTLEDELKGFMILLYAEMRCLNSYLEPGKRSQIRSLIKEICDAIRARNDVSKIEAKVEQLTQLLKETKDTGPEPERKDKGTGLEPR